MSSSNNGGGNNEEDDAELRRGPWTIEEDSLLIHYITCNGEGRWNMLAKCAGLKRTGKSCRLRWLNYLKPDVKRGNLSPQEQLLILELHAKWGNRWSKIAQHLPGRTDNEIKNFWRTRVQKQARQLNNIEMDNHQHQQQTVSSISQSYSASSSSSAMCIQDTNTIPVSVSPPSHWHNIFTPSLGESFAPQGLADHHQPITTCPSNINYGNTLYTNSSNPFQNDDCYYVDSNHGTSSVNFGLADATRGQVAKSDWVMDDDMANSMWNNSDELWQFR